MSSDPHMQPLVNDVGVAWSTPRVPEDPFAALDDLMCVVEEFCPRWPDRPTYEGSTVFLL